MNRNTWSNQMTKHFSYSRLRTTAVAVAIVVGSALLLSGQIRTPIHVPRRRGLPKDWSMHHVVYSKPGKSVSSDRLQKLQRDPRYILQQELRATAAPGPSLSAPLAVSAAAHDNSRPDVAPDIDIDVDIAPASVSGPSPRGLMKALIPPV